MKYIKKIAGSIKKFMAGKDSLAENTKAVDKRLQALRDSVTGKKELELLESQIVPKLDFPKHLSMMMIRRGKDHNDLAAMVGCCPRSVMNWLNAVYEPKIGMLDSIAKALECDVNQIMYGVDYE